MLLEKVKVACMMIKSICPLDGVWHGLYFLKLCSLQLSFGALYYARELSLPWLVEMDQVLAQIRTMAFF